MTHKTTHKESIVALRRIEGQVKGVQKMVEDGKYCIDIITQIHAATNALYRVSEKILAKHMEYCVVDALKGKSDANKQEKIDEIMKVVRKIHKM